MKLLLVVAVLLCSSFALATAESKEWVYANRQASDISEPLAHHLADKADLFFRVADVDQDKLLSKQDILSNPHRLQSEMGASVNEFLSFMEVADTDKDGKLSRDELHRGLADGMYDNQEMVAAPGFLEMQSGAERRVGFIGGAFRGIKKGLRQLRDRANALHRSNQKKAFNTVSNKVLSSGKLDLSQDSCVMCQYVIERIEGNLKNAGIFGLPTNPTTATPAPVVVPTAPASESTESSFVELEQSPFDASASAAIEATRIQTRATRNAERERYNEIYRVTDVTLDDVCEQGMPADYYGYCKQVYQLQNDVVDGLRYQYRPTDICFRIGMCDKDSYITKGVHSRYK